MQDRFKFRAVITIPYIHSISDTESVDKECSIIIYNVDVFDGGANLCKDVDRVFEAIDKLNLSYDEKVEIKESAFLEDCYNTICSDYFNFDGCDCLNESTGGSDLHQSTIYESDFIKLLNGTVCLVVWDEVKSGFMLQDVGNPKNYICPDSISDMSGHWNCIIIGNIHEGIKEQPNE